jgi:hypothetical protein
MRFEIDGQEIELQGIKSNTIVVARPTRKLNSNEFRNFTTKMRFLSDLFDRYKISLIAANYDEITFEVIRSKEGEIH